MSTRKNMIANRYEVLSHIGQGGMADVFLAVDTILNRQVAIKILRADMSTDAVSILRFEREAQAAASLAHPNIVEIYDVGDYKGHHYIVMEYVTGKTLKQVIHNRGRLLNEEAVDIMKQLCSAIAEAHSRGIIHRDIKPQNVIVKSDGTVKILDFGIATAKGAIQLTQANNVMGSVHYLAPELAKGDPSSPQSDIYALGICFYEMLAGDVPFKADQAVQVALKHMRDPMPDIRSTNGNVPQSIENIITKATAKLPSQRYRSCDEMLADISTCLRSDRLNEKKLVLKLPAASKKPELVGMTSVDNRNASAVSELSDHQPVVKQNNTLTYLLVGILTIIIAIGIGFTLILSGVISFGPKTVAIPDIEGMTLTDAEEVLTENKLLLDTDKITYTLTTNVEKGQIISVHPDIGTEIDKESSVSVVISSGIGVTVQDYRGRKISEVQSSLSQYPYLKVNAVEEDSNEAPGTILRQEQLAANELFDPTMAAQITLVYSSYPTIEIPNDIIGMSLAEATNELEEMGAEVRTSNRDTTSMTQDQLDDIKDKIGQVIDCIPATGTSYTQKESNYITLYYY